jgi:all-trans-8'-apo-beta-carotenal 15,15'-oxygenase
MTRADHAPLLENAFGLDLVEESYAVEEILGEVPAYVRGSYYLNGPARFARGGQRYRHWLDGDGMVCGLRFDDGGVTFTSRFVRSTKLTTEEEAGRPIFRAFGTAFDNDRLMRGVGLQSPVNVSVYPAFGTLLAFGEQGLPWELDPETLETRGEYSFGGRLNPISPFSAHPNIDLESGELFNFGVSFSSRQPCINLYRFGPTGEMLHRRRLGIEAPCSVHDFGISSRFVVIYLAPYLLRMEQLLEQGATLMESLHWQPELGSRLIVARREDGEEVAQVEVGSAYSLHQINCFEAGGRLVVDVIELERPVYDQYEVPHLFPEVRRAQPVRYRLDIETGRVVERRTLPYRSMCDFPAIDTRLAARRYDDFWVLGIAASEQPGRKFFDQLVHQRWSTEEAAIWQAPPRHYLGGEPIFLPDGADARRGVVICQQFDAERRRSAFLLFDAHDVSAGPVAELRLRRPVHLGFHASFAAATGDEP